MSEQPDVRVEFKVRPVTRYIVTRYTETGGLGGREASSECKGEFDNSESAYQVGYALAKHDHDLLGYPSGDDRIQYPDRPVQADPSVDPNGRA